MAERRTDDIAEEIEFLLRKVPDGVPLHGLSALYEKHFNQSLDVKSFGFKNLEQYLLTIRDIARLEVKGRFGLVHVYPHERLIDKRTAKDTSSFNSSEAQDVHPQARSNRMWHEDEPNIHKRTSNKNSSKPDDYKLKSSESAVSKNFCADLKSMCEMSRKSSRSTNIPNYADMPGDHQSVGASGRRATSPKNKKTIRFSDEDFNSTDSDVKRRTEQRRQDLAELNAARRKINEKGSSRQAEQDRKAPFKDEIKSKYDEHLMYTSDSDDYNSDDDLDDYRKRYTVNSSSRRKESPVEREAARNRQRFKGAYNDDSDDDRYRRSSSIITSRRRSISPAASRRHTSQNSRFRENGGYTTDSYLHRMKEFQADEKQSVEEKRRVPFIRRNYDLFVSGFPLRTTQNDLEDFFSQYPFTQIRLKQPEGKEPYAFVSFRSYQRASEAFSALSELDFMGDCLNISFAKNTEAFRKYKNYQKDSSEARGLRQLCPSPPSNTDFSRRVSTLTRQKFRDSSSSSDDDDDDEWLRGISYNNSNKSQPKKSLQDNDTPVLKAESLGKPKPSLQQERRVDDKFTKDCQKSDRDDRDKTRMARMVDSNDERMSLRQTMLGTARATGRVADIPERSASGKTNVEDGDADFSKYDNKCQKENNKSDRFTQNDRENLMCRVAAAKPEIGNDPIDKCKAAGSRDKIALQSRERADYRCENRKSRTSDRFNDVSMPSKQITCQMIDKRIGSRIISNCESDEDDCEWDKPTSLICSTMEQTNMNVSNRPTNMYVPKRTGDVNVLKPKCTSNITVTQHSDNMRECRRSEDRCKNSTSNTHNVLVDVKDSVKVNKSSVTLGDDNILTQLKRFPEDTARGRGWFPATTTKPNKLDKYSYSNCERYAKSQKPVHQRRRRVLKLTDIKEVVYTRFEDSKTKFEIVKAVDGKGQIDSGKLSCKILQTNMSFEDVLRNYVSEKAKSRIKSENIADKKRIIEKQVIVSKEVCIDETKELRKPNQASIENQDRSTSIPAELMKQKINILNQNKNNEKYSDKASEGKRMSTDSQDDMSEKTDSTLEPKGRTLNRTSMYQRVANMVQDSKPTVTSHENEFMAQHKNERDFLSRRDLESNPNPSPRMDLFTIAKNCRLEAKERNARAKEAEKSPKSQNTDYQKTNAQQDVSTTNKELKENRCKTDEAVVNNFGQENMRNINSEIAKDLNRDPSDDKSLRILTGNVIDEELGTPVDGSLYYINETDDDSTGKTTATVIEMDVKAMSELVLELQRVGSHSSLLEVNSVVNVLVTNVCDDGQYFWGVAGVESEHHFEQVYDQLEKYSREISKSKQVNPVYKYQVQMASCMYEGELCRTWLRERNGRRCLVFFMDYGNSQWIDLKDLTLLPENFWDIPPATSLLKIQGNTTRDYLKNKINEKLRMRVLEYQGPVMVVNLVDPE